MINNYKLHTKYEQGISLIELILVMVAVGVLAILVASLPQSIQSIRNSGNTSTAREIASKELDTLRKLPYVNLVNGTNSFTDTSLTKLPSPTATYQIDDCPEDICTLGENTKKIKVDVNWMEQGKTKTVELSTLLSEGGLGQ